MTTMGRQAVMSSTYRVVKLLKNHLYPTYQLHAHMANEKTTPQDGLRLAALTTMHWLKTRLGDDVPEEWRKRGQSVNQHKV